MSLVTQSPSTYYDEGGISNYLQYGHYRYFSLDQFIDSFRATYVGKNKLCEDVFMPDVVFHATRALQEFSFDVLPCTQSVEFTVPSTLVFVMPINYINYVEVAWSDSNGILRKIYPTSKSTNAFVPAAAIDTHGGLDDSDSDGYNPSIDSATGGVGGAAVDSDNNLISTTADNFRSQTATYIGDSDADNLDDELGNFVGGRYGIDPQHAQANGSFFIDHRLGKFHFSSNLAGKTVVLKYISDGLPADSTQLNITNAEVPKLAEEAMIKHTLYGILSARKDTPQEVLARLKKERFAETRKAKIRLSNIKLEELTQVLRGGSKQIKH
mgnify:CR=1 FL=1